MPDIQIEKNNVRASCLLCSNTRPLDVSEFLYFEHYGKVPGIYICDECREAIHWAKVHMWANRGVNDG